ncbi:MAG: DUF5685 family protein [Clostridia bacterium]|nr:DUF5685 family protein [Clostridia bacterium]
MFGYISPDRPYLFIKDEELYKAMYCGVCKGIKKGCGQTARTALTYDMAFMSALVHNIAGQDIVIEKQHCVIHPFKKRPMACADEITVLLGCINTALAYYKLLDDKNDKEARSFLRFFYKKGYKRAIKKCPAADKIIAAQMAAQAKLEKDGCAIIDMACEPSAEMMKELCAEVLGDKTTPYAEALSYAVGKWVYLADALDDYDKDVKKGRYNVLYKAYGDKCKEDAVNNNRDELIFIFDNLFADMRESLANIKFHFNHDLTDNIILRGIPLKTRQLLFGGCGMQKQCKAKTEVKDVNEKVQS